MKEEMRYSVVRRGTSLVLAATLATSMVPTLALAQDDAADGATPIVQADQQQKQYNLEVGKAYTVDVTYGGEGPMAATAATMLQQYFGSSVDVIAQQDGTYNVVLGFVNYSAAIGDLTIDGTTISQADDHTYTFNVSSLDGTIDANIVIGGAMAGMFPNGINFTMSLDTSTLPVKEADASYESGYKIYYNGAENERVSSSFKDKVKVIPADGVYNVELTANSISPAGELGDITYDGKAVAKVSNEDGSVTYTLPLPSVDGTYDFNFSYTIVAANITHSFDLQLVLDGGTYSGGSTDPEPGQDDNKVNKTELNETIAAAKAIQQGTKTDEAYATLQEAIAKAEKAAANDKIPQAGVDAVLGQLKEAIIAFNTSADKPAEDPTPAEDTVNTADGFKLVAGKEYSLPVSFINATTGNPSAAASFMEATSKVVYENGSYSVTLTPTEAGKQALTAMSYQGNAATKNADGSYTISGISAINKDLAVSVTAPMGTVDMLVRLDTTSLPTVSGEPQEPSDNQGGNNNNNQNNNSGNNQNTSGDVAEQGFQVGHTYQVPTSWLKHDSSEESMAAKYFGDTALVRPQSDGTFKVSFSATSEGASHIISLAYNGSTLAQSGNQYTVSIPKADSDTVVPISMTIKEMEQLGGGAQVADMHLKLSQAKDLGTGQDNMVASSSTSLSQTGDNLAGVAGAAAVVAVVAGGVAVAARRRSNQQ